MLNLDTHILLHAVTGDLTAKERKLLEAEPWSMSAIVLWEIAKLSQLNRIHINLEDQSVIRVLSAVRIWPISIDIANASSKLDVQVDPADELIAATSIVHNLPLVTRDRKLRSSGLVEIAL